MGVQMCRQAFTTYSTSKAEIERKRDLADNFLYQEFGEQLCFSRFPIRNFADWALYVGARAVVTLFVRRPNGAALLRQLALEDDPLPDRATLLSLGDMIQEGSEAKKQWLATLFHGPHGLFAATEMLLIAYSRMVRAERARLQRAGRP